MIPPTLFFFLRITFAMQGFLWLHMNFWNICSSSVLYVAGILIEVALNLQIALQSMDILMMLICLIHEHGMCLYSFVSSSISFFNVLQFSEYGSFTSLVRFIPIYFILFKNIYFVDYAITVVPFFSSLYSPLPCTSPPTSIPQL